MYRTLKRGTISKGNRSEPTGIFLGTFLSFRGDICLFAGNVFIGILREASKWLVATVQPLVCTLYTWMSQGVGKWLVNALYPTYK